MTTGNVTSFNPNVGSTVNSLALSSDGSTLYVGGAFTTVNGSTTRNRLAALSTSTGTATSFNPNVGGTVSSLALSSVASPAILYAGGTFTTVNGSTTRNNLAAFDTSTGTATAFDPNVNNTVNTLALSPDDLNLYAGGTFTTVNGSTTRNRLAAFATSTATATSANPNMNNTVNSIILSPDGTTLYAGGTFTTVVNGLTGRNNIAVFTSAGAVTAVNPNANGGVYALGLSGTTLYAAGDFSSIGGATRHGFAPLSTSTGLVNDGY